MLEYRGKPTTIDPIYERDCIVDYVSQTWRVQTKEKSLSDVVDIILAKGIDYGIYFYEHHQIQRGLEKYLSALNSQKDTLHGGKEITTSFKPREGIEYVLKYELQIKNLKQELRPYLGKNISPKTNTKKPKFNGKKTHFTLSATGPESFPASIGPKWVAYYQEDKRQTYLETIVGAIFTQGMNLGILAVIKEYGVQGEKIDQEIARELKKYHKQKKVSV